MGAQGAVMGKAEIVLTGHGRVVLEGDAPSEHDPLRWLRVPKMRKYMGLQDDLAVSATGLAVELAGLVPEQLGERAGLFLAVGYIPFDRKDIERLVTRSTVDGRIDMDAFSTAGFRAIHPLLTFRCLPNMPAYHISTNFDVQGSYYVTYPGAGQLYLAIEHAVVALEAGKVDVALVGGVAHQRNFLVEHLGRRLEPPVVESTLADAAAFFVLERAEHAVERGASVLARLVELEVGYMAHDPFAGSVRAVERCLADGQEVGIGSEFGAASMPAVLGEALERGGAVIEHVLESRDGIRARSAWRVA